MRNDCGVRQAPHEQLKVNRRRVWPHGQIIDREFTGGSLSCKYSVTALSLYHRFGEDKIQTRRTRRARETRAKSPRIDRSFTRVTCSPAIILIGWATTKIRRQIPRRRRVAGTLNNSFYSAKVCYTFAHVTELGRTAPEY